MKVDNVRCFNRAKWLIIDHADYITQAEDDDQMDIADFLGEFRYGRHPVHVVLVGSPPLRSWAKWKLPEGTPKGYTLAPIAMGDENALEAYLRPFAAKLALPEPLDVSDPDLLKALFEVTAGCRDRINGLLDEAVANALFANAPLFSREHLAAAVSARDPANHEPSTDARSENPPR